VAVAGGGTLGLRRGDPLPKPTGPLYVLDETSFGVLALVGARVVSAPDDDPISIAHRADASLRYVSEDAQADLRMVLKLLENGLAGILTRGSAACFSELSPEGKDRAIERWMSSPVPLLRGAANSLRQLCLGAHYSPLAYAQSTGYPGPFFEKPEAPPITADGPLSPPFVPTPKSAG
jgi:hypothetical protein